MTDKAESFEVDNLKDTLAAWREGIVPSVAVGELLSRCPVAHKWKAPYRCLVVREALLRRMIDIGSAIEVLTDSELVLGVRILLRSAVETTALLEFMAQKIDAVVAGKLPWSEFDTYTMRITVGSRDESKPTQHEAINVMTAVQKSNKAYPALLNIFNRLSESAHPNYDGVTYAYSRPLPDVHETQFGNYWQENFGHQQEPGTAYVFGCFSDAYNVHWIRAMVALEQWLRDNDSELEAQLQTKRSDTSETP